jgi:hypothetical protein
MAALDLSELRDRIDTQVEWLLVPPDGATFAINRDEIEIEQPNGKMMFGFLDDRGYHTWRLNSFDLGDEDIRLDLAGAYGKRRVQMRLVPRASALDLAAEIEAARQRSAAELAKALKNSELCSRLERVDLVADNSRLVRLFFTSGTSHQMALADITGTIPSERLLTTAHLMFEKLSVRKKQPVSTVWVIAEKKRAFQLQAIQALLRSPFRASVRIALRKQNGAQLVISPLGIKERSHLWSARLPRAIVVEEPAESEVADRITATAPEKIDSVFSRHGTTARFLGLPFARIRKMADREKAWFGIDRDRRLLNEENSGDLWALVADLDRHRSPDGGNRRHLYYRHSPEAWLESLLRRNIKLLDQNLELSPVHAQFRAHNDRIDLLALRNDGRLVIVELKTSPDREMVFLAADYWRKVEHSRRRGQLRDADLFNGREIADRPALIYLAAPAWSFHPDFGRFASMLDSEIELWRFEIHEDWRRELRVIDRRSYSGGFSGLTNL